MSAGGLESSNEGRVKAIDGPTFGRSDVRPIDLVFRTVGERTSDLALELAIQHIQPRRIHVLKNIKPFSRAVARMLELDHGDATHVVHMDADCLILEDLRPFLEHNDLPYVDCYVHDRFRGRIHCGVHITRIDVVNRMRSVPVPEDDMAYVLRPESRLRNLALNDLSAEKQLKGFRILHDHFQHLSDIFAKYALRELRSRTEFQKARLDASMARWGEGTDYEVARAAADHAARTVPEGAKPKHVEAYIRNLPFIAEEQIRKQGLNDQPALTLHEVKETMSNDPSLAPRGGPTKVFGLGLSRTGTRSLTAALHVLGFDTVHYPTDAPSFEAMTRGDGAFPLLDHYDGLTDITTIPFLAELDARYPGSKFVLTIRDEAPWLQSCANHWDGRTVFATSESAEPTAIEEHRIHMEIRRFLRAAVYGCYDYSPERFARVRADHHAAVLRYFARREQDLLVVDLTAGSGWTELAPFLGQPIPDQPFPHKGRALSEKLAASQDPDD